LQKASLAMPARSFGFGNDSNCSHPFRIRISRDEWEIKRYFHFLNRNLDFFCLFFSCGYKSSTLIVSKGSILSVWNCEIVSNTSAPLEFQIDLGKVVC
jgi:hypothetical protein